MIDLFPNTPQRNRHRLVYPDHPEKRSLYKTIRKKRFKAADAHKMVEEEFARREAMLQRGESLPEVNSGIYRIDIPAYFTAYVKADSKEAALAAIKDLGGRAGTLREDVAHYPPITGLPFDSPRLPPVSLSPAITFQALPGDTIVEQV